MKKILLPLLLAGLIASCGPVEPSTNPTISEPSLDPTTIEPSTSLEDPTVLESEDPTVSEQPSTTNPDVGGNNDITIEIPDDLGVDLVSLDYAKKMKKGDYLYVYGVVAQFTYGYGSSSLEKTGFYLVDNTNSMYIYTGAGSISNLKIGQTVLVNGSITYFISQQEAGAGAEIGFNGAQQIAADIVEIIEDNYHEIPDSGIETKTIKELASQDFREKDLSGTIFKTKATISHTTVSGTEVYYFNDASMDYSLYTYSTVSGAEYDWIQQYVGKTYECIIAVHSLRSRDEAWRIVPIDFYYESEISHDEVAEGALNRLAKQFNPTYNSSTSISLRSYDEKLGEDYPVTYKSSSSSQTITNDGGYALNINASVFEKFNITIKLSYNNKIYEKVVEIEIIEKLDFDGITLAQLQNTPDNEVVKVKGILMRSAANVQGVYIADDTGIAVIYYKGSFNYDDYLVGEEMIFEGTVVTDFDQSSQNFGGYKRLSNAELISHDSIVHEWNKSLVEETKTIEELYGADISTIGKLYKTEGKVINYGNEFYSNKRLYNEDETAYLTLYCGNQSQIAWLDDYANKLSEVYIFVRDIKANGALRFEILDIINY